MNRKEVEEFYQLARQGKHERVAYYLESKVLPRLEEYPVEETPEQRKVRELLVKAQQERAGEAYARLDGLKQRFHEAKSYLQSQLTRSEVEEFARKYGVTFSNAATALAAQGRF